MRLGVLGAFAPVLPLSFALTSIPFLGPAIVAVLNGLPVAVAAVPFIGATLAPVVAAAVAAAQVLGFTPAIHGSGGGSDANIYAESGIACAVISTGMVDVHTPQEHIAIADMVDAARLLQEIVAAG